MNRIMRERLFVLFVTGLTLAGCHVAPRQRAMETETLVTLPNRGTDTMRVHYLNVGSGMCHVVECPGASGEVFVDDCGSANANGGMSKEAVEARVQALTAGHPVKVVITHSDRDHGNYIPTALPAGTNITQIWAGGPFNRYSGDIQAWVVAAAKSGANVTINGYPNNGNQPLPNGWDNGLNPVAALSCGTAQTYVPTVNSGDASNPSSLMVRFAYAGATVLLPGDATAVTQDQAIANAAGVPGFLTTTVLEMSHHGASTNGSNDTDWTAATTPTYLFASAGQSYGHPRCDAIANYDAATLAPAARHDVYCGTSNTTGQTLHPTYALYATNSQGTIVADIAPTTSNHSITLYCGDGTASKPCP